MALLLPADVATSLGRVARLTIARLTPHGALLAIDAVDDSREILLPNAEVPANTNVGDALEVFVHLDSEDRPIATLRAPKLVLGEVAFLEVKDLTSYGAFFDWGLVKELLVPRGEQTRDVRVGERHPIGLIVDDTGRLAGTMRVSEMLRAKPSGKMGEIGAWVSGEAWRSDPATGLYVIVERTCVGRVPRDEPHTLARGQAAQFRVTHVLADGKIDLSLRAAAHEELESDAKKILEVLAHASTPKIGDHSSPEQIRSTFGLSKKAFKRAAGRLLKQGLVDIDSDGVLRAHKK